MQKTPNASRSTHQTADQSPGLGPLRVVAVSPSGFLGVPPAFCVAFGETFGPSGGSWALGVELV